MTLAHKIQSMLYAINSRNVPKVAGAEFVGVLKESLESMLNVVDIDIQAGNKMFTGSERREDLQYTHIKACMEHISTVWMPMHLTLNSCKPKRQYKKVHQTAMITSECYGETLSAYIECNTMLMQENCISTDAWAKKKADGREWDKRTGEYGEQLFRELEALSIHEPNKFGDLLSDETTSILKKSGFGRVSDSWD